MSSEIVISIQNVSKRYEMYAQPRDRLLQLLSFGLRQYFKEFWALRDISFDVARGETVGIIGKNGSGKSTLLQILAGTLTPTTGSVQTKGVLAALLELGSGFNPDFTGRENVYLNGSILGLSQEEMDSRFDAIAGFADIGEHLDQPVKTYSSGMYVRLAFAVQACIEPQILIIDEALSVGDEKFQRKCFDYIDGLRVNGCSILLVTHSTATVEKFCQRGVLLHNGEIHGIGPAKTIVDQYHALLYSDENAYLRYINSQSNVVVGSLDGMKTQLSSNVSLEDIDNNEKVENLSLRAIINKWRLVNEEGNHCEVFKTGDISTVSFDVDVFSKVKEIQAGILIRTVEGVSAFGTSTLYHDKNYNEAKSGDRISFSFTMMLALCPGTYFITLAIAEAISYHDMIYLDRKTDVIVFNIRQSRIINSGIASLDASVAVSFDRCQ